MCRHSFAVVLHVVQRKNHTKTKKTPLTVWNAQNLHTLDSHIILKLSVSTTKLSTLRGENSAYAALSEQEDSDKRKTVLPYKKIFSQNFRLDSWRVLAQINVWFLAKCQEKADLQRDQDRIQMKIHMLQTYIPI